MRQLYYTSNKDILPKHSPSNSSNLNSPTKSYFKI